MPFASSAFRPRFMAVIVLAAGLFLAAGVRPSMAAGVNPIMLSPNQQMVYLYVGILNTADEIALRNEHFLLNTLQAMTQKRASLDMVGLAARTAYITRVAATNMLHKYLIVPKGLPPKIIEVLKQSQTLSIEASKAKQNSIEALLLYLKDTKDLKAFENYQTKLKRQERLAADAAKHLEVVRRQVGLPD